MAGPSRAYWIHRFLWGLLDLVFPPRCAGCDKPGTRLCPECLQKVKRIEDGVCPHCGRPEREGRLCWDCRTSPPCFTALRSWAAYDGPVENAIKRLKYGRDLAMGETLAGHMLPLMHTTGWTVDMVVPMPLHKRRQSERGYNQAGLIARPLAQALGLPYAPKALSRWRETRSQVGLSREQRRENVRGVFRAASEGVRGRKILLIDDVATTCSTLSSAAHAALAAGAACVYALTAARAAVITRAAEPGEP